jgi:hypothetical protein
MSRTLLDLSGYGSDEDEEEMPAGDSESGIAARNHVKLDDEPRDCSPLMGSLPIVNSTGAPDIFSNNVPCGSVIHVAEALMQGDVTECDRERRTNGELRRGYLSSLPGPPRSMPMESTVIRIKDYIDAQEFDGFNLTEVCYPTLVAVAVVDSRVHNPTRHAIIYPSIHLYPYGGL